MSDIPADPQRMADFRDLIQAAAEVLDDLDTLIIDHGLDHDLLVLHGFAMFTRDTARAVLDLLDAGHELSAAALTRIALEHATVAQWVATTPDGAKEFLRQGEINQHRWYKVVEEAQIELPEHDESHHPGMSTRTVKGLATPKHTFTAMDPSKQLYLQYRHLSKYAHPDITTLARYTKRAANGLALLGDLQTGVNRESLLYFLATSVVLAALPYVERVADPETHEKLTAVAAAMGVVVRLGST